MDLTDSQQEALLNFQAITECYDLPEALHYLSAHNWDPTVSCTQPAATAYFSRTSQVPPPLIDSDPWEDMMETPADRLATVYSTFTNKLQSVWNRFSTS